MTGDPSPNQPGGAAPPGVTDSGDTAPVRADIGATTAPDTRATVDAPRTGDVPSRAGTAAMAAAASLLGAACVTWAAVPVPRSGLVSLALPLAAVCVAAGMARLALAGVPRPHDDIYLTVPQRVAGLFLDVLRHPPWEEGAAAAMLWLEALHPARPWHTALLGAALIGYLLAVHLAETAAPPRVLRPQSKVLAAGAVLLAFGAGVAMIPAAGSATGGGWLGILAAAAAIAAAALALPLWPLPPQQMTAAMIVDSSAHILVTTMHDGPRQSSRAVGVTRARPRGSREPSAEIILRVAGRSALHGAARAAGAKAGITRRRRIADTLD